MKEINEFIKPGTKEHSIPVPVQHWQLRDMLKSTNDALIFCQGNKINKYSVEDKKITELLTDLSFFPTSISATETLLIVGGQKGQYALKNLETGQLIVGTVGHAINNAVKICNFNNQINFLFCNNDNTIRRYSSDTLEEIQVIEHPWPVNNCEMSPNGKHLVSVGDTNQMFFFNVEDDRLVRHKNLKNMEDGGFKVSWKGCSSMFAVSTQDGYVCVYDTRKLTNFIKIPSKQRQSIKGACRNVEFTKSRSLDLLIFTEHVSFFTIVDARNFRTRQSVRIVEEIDKQISGSAFIENQEKFFVSTDDKIYEYDLENRRTFGTFIYD